MLPALAPQNETLNEKERACYQQSSVWTTATLSSGADHPS